MASLIVAGILLAIAGGTFAAFPFGQLYPFDIDSLLTCYVDNPLAGREGEPDFIPEETIRLPFAQVVGQFPEIWLPEDTTFRIPNGIPNIRRLVNFLGSDYDPLLTSFSRPDRDAPRGCETLPSSPGSGGNFRVHVSVDQDPTPLLNNEPPSAFAQNNPFFRLPYDVVVTQNSTSETLRDPASTLNPLAQSADVTPQNLMSVRQIFLDQTNQQEALCEIWTGICPLGTTWAELPDGYLPKFFAQGTCSGKNCSFPRGKHCEEDFQYVAHVTVLRWDCCFDRALGQIQWACGWRKVAVPLVCDCMCACTEVHVPLTATVSTG